MRYISYCFSTLLLLFFFSSCGSESTPVYSLTTTATPEEAGSVSPYSGEYDEGETVEITATPNADWVFDGWEGDASGSDNPTSITIDGDKDIAATFVLREYPLTIETEGEGNVQEEIVQEKTTNYPAGTVVKLTAIPDEGWEFVGWRKDASGEESEITVTVDRDKTIIASFDDSNFEAGDGSEKYPYRVATIEQLQNVQYYVDSHFIQVNDIDASETENWNDGQGFKPIGDDLVAFTGSYSGNGKNISNLKIKRDEDGGIGLFGYARDATITDVSLLDVEIKGSAEVGGIIGVSEDSKVNDVVTSGFISANRGVVGGVIGRNRGHLSVAKSSASIAGTEFSGGIVGGNHGEVIDSEFTGKVTGSDQFGFAFGGITGQNFGLIKGSHSDAEIKGRMSVGGISGGNTSRDGKIEKSYSYSNVTSYEDEAGGLVGNNNSTITQSYSLGNISGEKKIGGLIGSNSGQISDSYATGNVTGNDEVGGLIGTSDNDGEIERVFSVGEIDGDNDVGGIIGVNGGTFNAGYWDTESTNQPDGIGRGSSDGTTGLATSEIQGSSAEENMPEFDWDEIWMTVSDDYPILRWQE